jgi:hypothetical protein
MNCGCTECGIQSRTRRPNPIRWTPRRRDAVLIAGGTLASVIVTLYLVKKLTDKPSPTP